MTTRGWPTVAATGDRFLLVLDASEGVEQAYRKQHPSLSGRVMFGLYDETQPEAAVLNLQEPVSEQEHIRKAVAQGFLVRTRSDSATLEARAHDYRRLQAALRSGAQIISTDYYRGAPDPLGLHFVVSLPTP